jgi:hypothetical protein
MPKNSSKKSFKAGSPAAKDKPHIPIRRKYPVFLDSTIGDLCDVNALDVGVRVGAAHEDGVALRLHRDVVGVVARTGQKAVVLFAAQGFADVGKFGKI